MTEFIFVREKDFSLVAKEIIRELDGRPYLLLRITVSGPYFPHRDSAPFVRIADERHYTESLMAEVSPDNKELRGYFPTDVRMAGRVEFGYASQVIGSLPIRKVAVDKLDPDRVDANVRRVTLNDLGPFKVQRPSSD